MHTKHRILEILEQHRGQYLSGEHLASLLGISRSAIWKAIRLLKSDGHAIVAVPKLGYALSEQSNVLSAEGILPYLLDPSYAAHLSVYSELVSTNQTAKQMAVDGAPHGTVVLADCQTGGYGRYGRPFYSPSQTGLYMSVILRNCLDQTQTATLMTAAAAVAVISAIQSVTGIQASIKWVNDIFIEDKKVCGILTEAMTDFESRSIAFVVIGIGININTASFPTGLGSSATCLLPESDHHAQNVRNRLAAELMNIFLSSDDWLYNPDVYTSYKQKLTLLGHPVTVTQGTQSYQATAIDLDEACHLIVKKADGSIVRLSSAEVSVTKST